MLCGRCKGEFHAIGRGARLRQSRNRSSALEDIQLHLASLQKRRRTSVWLLANQEKERVAQLSGALNDALALFSVCGLSILLEDSSHLDALYP